MNSRIIKLEKAKTIIFNPIVKTGSQKVFLMLESMNILVIGKKYRKRIPDFSNLELENMLNLLQQYSYVQKYERVCGNTFRVIINFPSKGNAKIISINQILNRKTG